eukprot:5397460-Pleurochrysis_carterae.AAC.3
MPFWRIESAAIPREAISHFILYHVNVTHACIEIDTWRHSPSRSARTPTPPSLSHTPPWFPPPLTLSQAPALLALSLA